MLFLKNQKRSERTIAHIRDAVENRDVVTETDFKLQK
jgi:hypothetical protein